MALLLNFASIGFEAHYHVVDGLSQLGSTLLFVAELIFTLFFLVEMGLRILVTGIQAYFPKIDNFWNVCDLLLVALGVVISWIIPIVEMSSTILVDRSSLKVLSILLAIRLFRFISMVRRVKFLKQVWLLMKGLADSMRIIVWIIVVIFFLVYIFAVFGLFLIAKPIQDQFALSLLASTGITTSTITVGPERHLSATESGNELLELHDWTAGMDKFMYFLVNILTGDEYYHVIRNIQDVVPFSWIYFYTYTAILSLVVMNLITATIIDYALTHSKLDEQSQIEAKDAEQRAEIEQMRTFFTMMDENGDGTLSWEEFVTSFEDPCMAGKWQLMDFTSEDCASLFKVLDDGDGEIETSEFFEGLRRMRGAAKSKDVYQVYKLVEKLSRRIDMLSNVRRVSGKGQITPSIIV